MIYDDQIAKRYKLYRPALHDTLLKRCLNTNKQFALALDIGCGVGHSTEALIPFCEHIIGIDRSEEMLGLAPKLDSIIYEKSSLPTLSYRDDSLDLITFAGSLFYCKSQELLDECVRVLKDESVLLIYDFDVELDVIIKALLSKQYTSDYDHSINFDDLNLQHLSKMDSNSFTIHVDIELKNVIHLLLSDQELYNKLSSTYGIQRLEQKIYDTLEKEFPKGVKPFVAHLYFTTYIANQ